VGKKREGISKKRRISAGNARRELLLVLIFCLNIDQGCTQENVRTHERTLYLLNYLGTVLIFLHIIDLELKADSVMCKNINMVHG
jgi:hypothetical protein